MDKTPRLRLIKTPDPVEVEDRGIRTHLEEWCKLLEKQYDQSGSPQSLSQMLSQLLKVGDVAFLFAVDETAATAVLLKILEEYLQNGNLLVFSSAQMDEMQAVTRLMSQKSKIPIDRLRSGRIFSSEWAAVTKALAWIQEKSFPYLYSAGINQQVIKRELGFQSSEGSSFSLCFLNGYLHDLPENQEEFIQLKDGLKKFACENNTAILASATIDSLDSWSKRINFKGPSKVLDDYLSAGPLLVLKQSKNHIDIIFFVKNQQEAGCIPTIIEESTRSIVYGTVSKKL